MKNTFKNPILKGAYPDPSICRVGDTYYLVCSTFYYFPGLPVFESKDLIHWKQICNAIEREEQLDFRGCESSEGLWAPSIRYHDGTFYLINTLCTNGRELQYNFIMTATNPAGPWSNAVIVEGAAGIDPSLFFDDDGRMWYCSNRVPKPRLYPSQKEVYIGELDKETFQFIGEPKVILDGIVEHSDYMEAPHIYHENGYYYLMTACGGTQTNHSVHMARAKQIEGPYEVCPRNPVITNRNVRLVNKLGISVIGHGDLVQTQNGEWYMVLLGIRPYEYMIEDYDEFLPRMWIRKPDRNKNAQFNLGRETFLVPVDWEFDGWLIVDNDNGMVNPEERKPNLPECIYPAVSRVDNFEDDTLDFAWCTRRTLSTCLYSLTERPGYLRLKTQPIRIQNKESLSMLVRRQQDYEFLAGTVMEFVPKAGDEAGIVITQNERYSYGIVKTSDDGVTAKVRTFMVKNGKRETLAEIEVPMEGRLYLSLEGHEGTYQFLCGLKEKNQQPIGEKLGAYLLSTCVADGFIGTYLGMYASSDSKKAASEEAATNADFDWFRYESLEA